MNKKVKYFIGLFVLLSAGVLWSATHSDFTDLWSILDGNTPVAYIDSTGDLNIYNDDILLGSSGTQPSTTAGAYPSIKVPLKNCGSTAWAQGTLVVVDTLDVGCGKTSPATNDLTTWVGVSEGTVAAGSIGYIVSSGYALALTTGTVNRGDVLVSTVGATGYMGADTTPTTGADVAVALSSGTSTGGLTLIKLR